AGAARAGRDARAGVTMRSTRISAPSAPATDGRLPTSMLAVVLTGPGVEGLTLQRVDVVRPGPMELLCHVDAVYICGTDPHIVNGDYEGFWPTRYPFTPGHEWAATH